MAFLAAESITAKGQGTTCIQHGEGDQRKESKETRAEEGQLRKFLEVGV